MDERQMLEMLRANVVLLRTALMVGNPAPIVETMGRATRAPIPGDLVIETSTIYFPLTPSKIGTLLREVREDIAGADILPDGRKQTERVFYIRGLDGQGHRWVNCDFMRIARDERDTYEIEGRPLPPSIYSQDERRQGFATESRTS